MNLRTNFRRLSLAHCLILVLLAACNIPPTAANSGVEGQVFIGPACPVVALSTPCPDQPFQTTITVRDSNGRQVTEFQTDAQGRFRVGLNPGTYLLVPESPGGPTRAAEQSVTVASGRFTQVTINYDSGIR